MRLPAPLRRLPVLLLPAAFAACDPSSTADEPAPEVEERSITETRPITDVRRRTIGWLDEGVWISNEMAGGRVSDAWREGDSTFVVEIVPENAPVNNSAWYAFKVWSRESRDLDLRLTYEDGDHRYWPKTRRAGEPWSPLDSASVRADTASGDVELSLRVGPDTLWVAGQEMRTSAFFDRWTDSLAGLPHVTRRTFATTPRGRPLRMVELGDSTAPRHVFLISRQHPPEITGTVALVRFVEEMAGPSPLAERFRASFRVHVVPLMNPDGVDLGHWRHNTGGVDLNRDWVDFKQPETTAARDEFLRIMEPAGSELWFAADFHSTRRDVFYTLERTFETDPPGVTDRWLQHISDELPDYTVEDSPSDLTTPTSRNWFYREFGAPALIYEVGDDTDRARIREVAATAARGTMEILLDVLEEGGGQP